ncbi:aminotransferase [Sphingomonas sp. Leaf339]|uniref:cysteine desulfurase family protein n=1 Tax=Sphingomonas sp. Leaf339 TaxID=1736343 RepID=UPI0006FE58C0|nr:cysteine desulfurase family protein [Sphingomonas sp. Leaf339]KQU62622.1 aminotransferase [Sphingomonas sp. Leaf339]
MIYLDYQATTPLAPEALAAMLPWLRDQHANPHSSHRPGRAARAAVEVARDQVAALCPPGGHIAFTSGATESLNWAIKGTTGPIVTLATEHAAVLDTVAGEAKNGRTVTILPVGPNGLVDLDTARAAIVPGVGLVVAMLVNNEIGVIQPMAELAAMAHAAGALMLCDAVQGYGRVPIPPACDFISISAHKVYGPKGIGALWIRDGIALEPLLHGGGQEAPGRSGTLSPALCAGFGVATSLMETQAEEDQMHIDNLWRIASARLSSDWQLNGTVAPRYRGNLNIRRAGLDVARLMSDCRDLAFSAGSACASGPGRSSHVLRAIGLGEGPARSSIRLGWGRYTSETGFTGAIDTIIAAAEAQRL